MKTEDLRNNNCSKLGGKNQIKPCKIYHLTELIIINPQATDIQKTCSYSMSQTIKRKDCV